MHAREDVSLHPVEPDLPLVRFACHRMVGNFSVPVMGNRYLRGKGKAHALFD